MQSPHFGSFQTPGAPNTPPMTTPPAPVFQTPTFAGSRVSFRNKDDAFIPWKTKYAKDKQSIHSFISWFESHSNLNIYTESEKCSQLLQSFGIDTPKILRSLPDPYTYNHVVLAVTEYYEPLAQRRSFRTLLQTRVRQPKETARQFGEELEELSLKALPTESPQERDNALLDLFLLHQDTQAKQALAIKNPSTLKEAVNFLETYEATVSSSCGVVDKPTPPKLTMPEVVSHQVSPLSPYPLPARTARTFPTPHVPIPTP